MNDHIPSDTSGARAYALELLEDILRRKRPLEEAFIHKKGLNTLAERDRQFVRLLVSTTLRHLGEIDHAIAQYLEIPLAARAYQVKDILRLGAAQSLFLNTPAYAVVDTMVSLAGQNRQSKAFKGLVNAILRKIASEKEILLAAQPKGAVSLPDWLWQSWARTYGIDRAKAIALAHLHEPPLDISVKADPEIWAERLNATLLPTGTLRFLHKENIPSRIEDLPFFRDGAWWVQDFAASLPVKLAGSLKGKKALDLCASPGGKSAQLAAGGAEVLALERARGRMERLKQNMIRLKLSVQFDLADAVFWSGPQDYDLVLLDAPCSATGTIRRHPDVAWVKEQKEIPSLVKSQAQLLKAAYRHLRPGGMLIYCVCSLQPEEGEVQIARFLEQHSDMVRLALRPEELPGLLPAITPQGDMRTMPSFLSEWGGMDGFFASRLIKNG